MRLIELYEGYEQADEYTKITNDFIDNIVAVAMRGKSLFDVETRRHGLGYTVIVTTKVPGPSGYLRTFFRVLTSPSGAELLRDITNEDGLGTAKATTKRYPIHDASSAETMTVEQYRKDMLQRTRVWRYLFFGGYGIIGLMNRWSGTSASLKALRLVQKQPPPISGEEGDL